MERHFEDLSDEDSEDNGAYIEESGNNSEDDTPQH